MPLVQHIFLFFTFSELKISNFNDVNTHTLRALIFLPNPNFAICLNFQRQNPFKNQYLPYISSENCGINSVESDSPRAFQQHQKCPQIPIQFSVWILFNFHWENGSIINSFDTVAPNSLKPSRCTPTHQELSKDTRAQHEVPWFGRSQSDKTNYLAS